MGAAAGIYQVCHFWKRGWWCLQTFGSTHKSEEKDKTDNKTQTFLLELMRHMHRTETWKTDFESVLKRSEKNWEDSTYSSEYRGDIPDLHKTFSISARRRVSTYLTRSDIFDCAALHISLRC